MASKYRKRHKVEYAAKVVHIVEHTSPFKKRYTRSIPSTGIQHPAGCSTSLQGICKTDKVTPTTLKAQTNPLSSECTRISDLFCSKASTSIDLNKVTSNLKNPASITPTIKFPTRTEKENTSISVATALNYPTELIPLTAEDRKLNTIRQLIAEKLRLLRRDKLVLLKSAKPNPHEKEICLTVVKVANSDDSTSREDTSNYAVLQEDTADTSDLFKIILNEINKKILGSKNSEHRASPDLAMNAEYAKQIETEVIMKITALRKQEAKRRDSEPFRDKRMLYVMFEDGDDVGELEPSSQLPEDISENDRRERQFTELFDNIFQKLSRESTKRRMFKSSNAFDEKSKGIKVVEWQEEYENDQTRHDLQLHSSTTLDNLEAATIERNGMPMGSFLKINWWQWPTGYCTKKLLPELCDKTVMSTHSLRGTNSDNGTLKSEKVDDLTFPISDNSVRAPARDVHQAIMLIARSHKAQMHRTLTKKNNV